MRLTTKGRFAVTAMIDLALNSGDGPVTLAAISERQKISLSYLEQLFGRLRRYGLVESVRGPGGGYCLARPDADITIADVVRAVEEPFMRHGDAEAPQIAGQRRFEIRHRQIGTGAVFRIMPRHRAQENRRITHRFCHRPRLVEA